MAQDPEMKRIQWSGISPWLIGGVIVVLIPLYIFLTLNMVKKQEDGLREFMLVQGETLIRSIEAGIRTGRGKNGELFQLQKLLMEMSLQPGLDHIIVIDGEGVILADTDPIMKGETYGLDLDIAAVMQKQKPSWRLISRLEQGETFEVYRRFFPPPETTPDNGQRRARIESAPRILPTENLAIFVGMNMGPVREAREKEMNRTIMTAIILLAIAIFGILSLFLAQAYRSTRLSLTRMKALSDGIISNMPIGLVAVDRRGKLVSCNREAEIILETSLSPHLGEAPPPGFPQSLLPLLSAREGGPGMTASERQVELKRGNSHLDIVTAATTDDDGAFTGRLMLLRDVTEFKRLREDLARNQRLAGIGHLAAGLAHEIRNPLSSIKGFATHFRERLKDDPEDVRLADIMIGEVHRLNRVITQILEFARPVAPRPQQLELVTLMRQVIEMISRQADSPGIQIRPHFTAASVPVMADDDQLRQVLVNLLLNAIEAMGKDGIVTVRLEGIAGSGARIIVEDTGPGIPEKDLPHVFDPYFTTKSAGTGLGLAIAHKIVEAHGGEIRLENRAGGGARATVILPSVTLGGVK